MNFGTWSELILFLPDTAAEYDGSFDTIWQSSSELILNSKGFSLHEYYNVRENNKNPTNNMMAFAAVTKA